MLGISPLGRMENDMPADVAKAVEKCLPVAFVPSVSCIPGGSECQVTRQLPKADCHVVGAPL